MIGTHVPIYKSRHVTDHRVLGRPKVPIPTVFLFPVAAITKLRIRVAPHGHPWLLRNVRPTAAAPPVTPPPSLHWRHEREPLAKAVLL